MGTEENKYPILTLKLVSNTIDEILLLQRAFDSAPEFSMRTTGEGPSPDAAKSALQALPPNKNYSDKFVFIILKESNLVGCCDLIRGYPNADIAWIGLLLIDERLHGKGYGRNAFEQIEKQIRAWPEIQSIRLSVVATNEQAVSFWVKMGFRTIDGRKPYQHGSVISELIIMEKSLSPSRKP